MPHRAFVVRRLLAALLAAALPVAAVLFVVPSADGETKTRTDPRRDVTFLPYDEEMPSSTVPGDRKTDIREFRTSYAKGKVQLRLTMRSAAAEEYVVYWRIRTPSSTWLAVLQKSSAGTTVGLYPLAGRVARGIPAECEGIAGGVKVATKRITTRVPRACLGNPATIRTGAVVLRNITGPGGGFRVDDARRDGSVNETNYSRARLGKVIGYN